MLDAFIAEFRASHDFLIVDTPGSDSLLARRALGHADTLLTPMNDSFIDLDILGQVDPEFAQGGPAEPLCRGCLGTAQDARGRGSRPIDWVVMRNRLGTWDS